MPGTSDGTHAIVNAVDPHTFVVDFGTATEGLDQLTLLAVRQSAIATPVAGGGTGGALAAPT